MGGSRSFLGSSRDSETNTMRAWEIVFLTAVIFFAATVLILGALFLVLGGDIG